MCLLTFFDSFRSHFLLSLFETIKERRTKLYLDQDITQCQKGRKNSNQFQKSCENNYSVVNYFPIFFLHYSVDWQTYHPKILVNEIWAICQVCRHDNDLKKKYCGLREKFMTLPDTLRGRHNNSFWHSSTIQVTNWFLEWAIWCEDPLNNNSKPILDLSCMWLKDFLLHSFLRPYEY